jgi:acetyl esterase
VLGRVYLEHKQPVEVLGRWGAVPAEPRTTGVSWLRPPRRTAPRNVLIRRADGTLVIRPFRGLRRPPDSGPGQEQ